MLSKPSKTSTRSVWLTSRGEEIRTPDLLLPKQAGAVFAGVVQCCAVLERPVETCASAPAGTVLLHPQPWRWFLLLALLGVSLTANLVMIRVRQSQPARRGLVIGLGMIGAVAALGVFAGGAVQAENLMVRGWVDSGWMPGPGSGRAVVPR